MNFKLIFAVNLLIFITVLVIAGSIYNSVDINSYSSNVSLFFMYIGGIVSIICLVCLCYSDGITLFSQLQKQDQNQKEIKQNLKQEQEISLV